MNKQEFIERMKSLKNIFGNKCEYVKIDAVIELASELDEPQKVQVPQFVADYIEFKKEYDFHVYGAMRVIEDHCDKRVSEWFYEKNVETFARAWLDGYEVEKEKKFAVKLTKTQQYLYCRDNDFTFVTYARPDGNLQLYHTRKELEEAGFGWVFDCDGIEVEEVE